MASSPAQMLDYLKSRGCRIGGVTLGERGLLWYDETGTVRTGPALPVPADTVIDTSGAGDVFHGAYIYSYLDRAEAAAGRSISTSRRAPRPSRSSISATRPACRRWTTSRPSTREFGDQVPEPRPASREHGGDGAEAARSTGRLLDGQRHDAGASSDAERRCPECST